MGQEGWLVADDKNTGVFKLFCGGLSRVDADSTRCVGRLHFTENSKHNIALKVIREAPLAVVII